MRDALRQAIASSSDEDLLSVQITPSSMAGVSTGDSVQVDVAISLSTVSWAPVNLLSFMGDPVITAQAIQDRE